MPMPSALELSAVVQQGRVAYGGVRCLGGKCGGKVARRDDDIGLK